MKKSSLFSLLVSAVMASSYFNINQNVVCGKINAQTNIASGNYIEINSGDFVAVQWDGDYRYSQIVSMDDSAIDITTIFSGNLCYTYINAYKSHFGSVTELRAYINRDEYISLFVRVLPYIPPDTTGSSITKTSQTTVSSSTFASQTTTNSYIETPAYTSTFSSTVATTKPDINTTVTDPELSVTKTSQTSLPAVSGTSVTDKEDITGPESGTSTSNSSGNNFYHGSVMSANEYGDVNSDGKVDVSDLTRLSLALLGDVSLTAAERFAADVIPSPYSIPDLADLVTLKQFIMKENVTFGPKYIVYR